MTVKQQSRFTTQSSRDSRMYNDDDDDDYNDEESDIIADGSGMVGNNYQSNKLIKDVPTPLSYSMVIRPEEINLSTQDQNNQKTKF